MTVRALLVGPGADRSGVPVGLLRLLAGLVADGAVQPSVLLLRGGPLVGEFEALAPTQVLSTGGRDLADLVPLAASELGAAGAAGALRGRRVRRAVQRFGPFQVAYLAGAASFAALEGLRPGAPPVVGHVHELAVGLARSLAPDQQGLLARPERLLAATPEVARLLAERVGRPADAIGVLGELLPDEPPPVRHAPGSLRRRLGVGEQVRLVGAVASPVVRKGPDLFVQLALRLRRSHPDAHLVWVAPDAAATAELGREVALAGVGDRFHLVDGNADVADWMRLVDVLVVPSREDAQPLVVLEAMQLQTPVVAFATGGLPDLLGEGARGLLVPPLDVGALAVGVGAVLDRPAAAAARAQRASSHVHAHHRVSVLTPRLRDELVALAARGPAPGRR